MTTTVQIMPPARRTRRSRRPGPRRHVVAAVAYDGLCLFEFGIVVELFGLPRPELPEWYDFVVCSDSSRPLGATGGVHVTPHAGLSALRKADTIVLPGWRDPNETPPSALITALLRAYRRGARLVSICSGVFALAPTGLLNGRRATTHWRYADLLKQRYPSIRVDPNVLYVDEGQILTSAGSAAGIDLCLHIIREDFGAQVANHVARRLVMPPHREGGQAQFVSRPIGDRDRPWLAHLLDWTQSRLNEPLDVARLAAAAHMSKRTLARRFAEATGSSPVKWLTGVRVSYAKELLESTRKPIERVAEDCGFGSAATMRHHFRQVVGMSPVTYRARFHVRRDSRKRRRRGPS